MNTKGIVPHPKWLQGKCPFCLEKLGTTEKIRRKISKKYKCKNCGKIIDERHIYW